MRKTLYTIIILVFLVALILFIPNIKATIAPHVFSSYKTAEYLIDGKPIVLGTNGTKYFGDEVSGDIDGDGKPDVAFLFTDEPGGSGTFYYAAGAIAKTNADGTTGYVGTNAVFLGDRIAPQMLYAEYGGVLVSFAERADSDPMTTPPHIMISSFYKFEKGSLVYIGSR